MIKLDICIETTKQYETASSLNKISNYFAELDDFTEYANAFDQFFSFQCVNRGFITDIQSYHDNGHEDRRFKFHCCEIQGIVYTNIKDNKQIS